MLRMMSVPEQILARLAKLRIEEVHAVTFRVEHAYDQTPGPTAGKQLS
jgi:hypothetical protein